MDRWSGSASQTRRTGLACLLCAGLALFTPAASALAEPPPSRVMSINVCTDQLAMLLAAPEQLVSVSVLASDPMIAYYHRQAVRYRHNNALAEEIFLAQPDLVLAGTHALHNTTALLRRVGVEVAEFPHTQTLDTIGGDIRRMGRLLGRSQAAEIVASNFESELAQLEADRCQDRPTAIAWEQNGIALAAGTLADSVMRAAGLRNLAAEAGYTGMAPFPLEILIADRPDIVILPSTTAGASSLADQALQHPALERLSGTISGRFVPPASWTCGGPFVLDAVRALQAVRDRTASCTGPRPAP